eukprot:TRINITY_DN70927_c0_g1_i1.p1 TRINITY_DN70927_c0_g1~~TRINITY_DN70927_c0_g1_i1.p1  ORF type:complete len:428 (-),score=53.63 TRINITY_DN70927_c0_g1_i1:23-1306(-)
MARNAVGRYMAPILRWTTEVRAANLERRLRQDPFDLTRRRAAVGLYSRQALAELQYETQGPEQSIADGTRSGEFIDRARGHLDVILKSSSDVNFLYDTLTRGLGPQLFYLLPESTAAYMRKIGMGRECLEEFDTKSEFEERATQYHFANALTILKATGRRREAQELFEEAIGLEWRGRRPIGWTCLEQTPAVYIKGLDHQAFWDGEHRLPLADVLEAHHDEIMQDLQEVLQDRLRSRNGGSSVPAYPALVKGTDGVWDMVQLYSHRRWHKEACALAPRATALLRKHLPSTVDVPYIHYNTEEAVLFLLAPGTSVHLHNGGSNVPLNFSLGLSGSAGTHIEVAGQTRGFRDGSVICFDDGSDHRVWHEGAEERWVLVVRRMHPQLASEPWNFFSRAFTRRTCFEVWDKARAVRLSSAPAAATEQSRAG